MACDAKKKRVNKPVVYENEKNRAGAKVRDPSTRPQRTQNLFGPMQTQRELGKHKIYHKNLKIYLVGLATFSPWLCVELLGSWEARSRPLGLGSTFLT